MSLFLATLQQCKLELGIKDLTDDALLLQWAEGLQAAFEQHLNRGLLYQAETEFFDGDSLALYVTRPPIGTLTSLHVSADQEWTADNLLDVADDDYRVDYRLGRIIYGVGGGTRWPAGIQNIRVAYTGGMFTAAGAVASSWVQQREVDAVKRAFLLQFGYDWRNRTVLGVEQLTAQGMTKKTPADFLKNVKEILNPLRRYA